MVWHSTLKYYIDLGGIHSWQSIFLIQSHIYRYVCVFFLGLVLINARRYRRQTTRERNEENEIFFIVIIHHCLCISWTRIFFFSSQAVPISDNGVIWCVRTSSSAYFIDSCDELNALENENRAIKLWNFLQASNHSSVSMMFFGPVKYLQWTSKESKKKQRNVKNWSLFDQFMCSLLCIR